MLFTGDFETTTDVDDCRVWAWALCEIGNVNNFLYGNSIDSLMELLFNLDSKITVYFHNLKFDGEFILYWLFKNGYTFNSERKYLNEKEFTTLISDRGVFYTIEICYYKSDTKRKTLKILDSLKILPFSIAEIAKAFSLPISKLEIDYKEKREIGHELTQSEIDYIRSDVTIAALGIEKLFEQNLKKMTTGSNAITEYKKIIGKSKFSKWFPPPVYDDDIRQSYRGGFTYLNPIYKNKDIGEGIVLDVNSLYPSVMYYNKLPYGEGIFFKGKYEHDNVYDLYIQMFSCQFVLKRDKIPTVQLKNNLAFVPTEYITNSGGEYVTMCMTNIDLELFLEHYEVFDINYISGWKFKSSDKLFKDYIDKWNGIKVKATRDKNKPMRTISKLMLNSLYGKFALNPNVQSKYPYLGEDNIVHYRLGPQETREPIYIPVGTFVTSWARYKTITSAQKVFNRFIYADTDSLHLVGTVPPENLDISDTELGCWKIESHFRRARFLRQKSYVEDEYCDIEDIKKYINDNPDLVNHIDLDNKTVLKITCAGMPSSCYKFVNWENFKIGNEFAGKLKISHTTGGIVLLDSPHTLRE